MLRIGQEAVEQLLSRGKLNLERKDGTWKVSTAEDYPDMIERLKSHVFERVLFAQMVNAGDGGPGGFAYYPVLARVETIIEDGEWHDLIRLEESFDRFYPDPDCPFELEESEGNQPGQLRLKSD